MNDVFCQVVETPGKVSIQYVVTLDATNEALNMNPHFCNAFCLLNLKEKYTF